MLTKIRNITHIDITLFAMALVGEQNENPDEPVEVPTSIVLPAGEKWCIAHECAECSHEVILTDKIVNSKEGAIQLDPVCSKYYQVPFVEMVADIFDTVELQTQEERLFAARANEFDRYHPVASCISPVYNRCANSDCKAEYLYDIRVVRTVIGRPGNLIVGEIAQIKNGYRMDFATIEKAMKRTN